MKPLLKKILRPLLAVSLSVSGVAVIATAVAASKESAVETKADVGSYYSGISDSATGTTLQTALHNLNESKIGDLVGYAGMRTFAATSDIDPDGSGKILGFYDNAKIGPSWDSGSTWNREHVWPNARGGSSVEDDAHMIRPASTSTNSGRGSQGFGTQSFDPGSSVAYYRGVAARIIFYCAIANTDLKITEDVFNSDYNSNKDPANTMGTLSDLLQWNLQYLPTDTSFTGSNDVARRLEIARNERIQTASGGQGNRNPFIDHPEYACRIWGSTNSSTQSICGGSASSDPSATISGSTSVAVGSNMTLTASLSNVTNAGNISWSSSNPSVATVSQNSGGTTSTSTAKVTGVAAGTTTISCKHSGTVIGSVDITVYTPGSNTNATFNFDSGGNCTSTSGSATGVSFATAQGSASNPPAYNTSSHELRMYTGSSGNGNTFTLTPDSGYTIKSVTITASSTSYTPTVKYKVDGGSDQTGTWSSTTMTISGISASSSFVFRNANTTNTQLRIKSVAVTLQTSGSSTTKTLSSISLNTDNVQKSFTVNDTFNYTGLVVTANYSDSTSATVTPTNVSSPTMSTTGQKTITVSYTEGDVTKTATYTITVNAATLSSIAVKTAPTKTSYTVGEYFAPAGLVITCTYSNSSTSEVTYSTSNASSFTFNPSTSTQLTTSHTSVTITYGGKSTTQAITVSAQSSGEYFQKVTSSTGLTSGDYLIVYESGSVAFDGSRSTLDAASNTISVTISNSKIDATTTTKASKFTIDTSAGTIKSASGYYIGQGSNLNGLGQNSNASTYSNTLTYSSGDVNIVSSGAYLRYNAGTNDLRFRYYKSSSYTNQQAIQLYKYYTNSTDSITLNKDSLTLVMGGSAGSITATPSGSGTVTWTSSDENVATVSNGSVSAVGTGTATITATYGTASATCTVNVTGATGTSPYVNGIPYKMYLTNSSNYFYTGSMINTYYGETSSTYSDGIDVYFEANGTGQNIYTLSGTTKTYFYVVTSGNFVNFKHDVTSAPETAWVYDSTASCIAFPIDGVKYTFGNSGTYTTFSAYNVDVNTSNYNVQFGLTGEGYAKIFYEAINCNAAGTSRPTFNSGYTWTSLGTLYNGLLDGAKAELQSATASENGSTYLANAAYRYDYIIAKYGVSDYANFMSRTVKTLPMSVNFFSSLNSESSTAIIVIASLVGLTSAFGLLMLKKRKED